MKVLYVGEDEWLTGALRNAGWFVSTETHVALSKDVDFDVMVMDLRGRAAPGDTFFAKCQERHDEYAIVAIVDDGAASLAARCTRLGATVLADSLLGESPGPPSVLLETVGRVVVAHGAGQHKIETRIFELLGLNALAQAVNTSLDATVVASRALDVLLGLAPEASTAIYTAEPRPTLSGDLAPSAGATKSWLLRAHRVGTHDIKLPSRLKPEQLAPYLESPGASSFVNDPIWEVPNAAKITVLPILGAAATVGVMILGESSVQGLGLRDDVLNAIAAQLGTALENAWLFEEVGEAYRSLQKAQDQLVHAEKFAAVGLLAAEIAHEINNPAAFVITNLSVMAEYVETVAAFHKALVDRASKAPISPEDFRRLLVKHEISFLDEDLEALVRRSLVGLERIHQIVMDLRYFSRQQPAGIGRVDIEGLLQSTVSLVRHEAKFRCEILFELEGVSPVETDGNRLSQVFLNLFVNAVQSIDLGAVEDNCIRVCTRQSDRKVWVAIEDSGPGVARELRPRIFEPFFTTKEPGSGTGLGLSISRDIMRSLGGDLYLTDPEGSGARFELWLPR